MPSSPSPLAAWACNTAGVLGPPHAMPSSNPDEAAMRLIIEHAMFRLRDAIGKDEYCCLRDVI